MSQQVFADRLGKSKSWLDKVERGVRGLDKFSVLHDIADALKVDPQLLLDNHEPAPTTAPRRAIPATTGLALGAARREVDILLRHHLQPAATREQAQALRQLMILTYAAMAAQQVDPQVRCRVVATACILWPEAP